MGDRRHSREQKWGAKMRVEELSDDVLLVVLPKEPRLRTELAKLNETLGKRKDCDVIIDLSLVEIITSSSISNLMILHSLLDEHGRKLILCNVALPTKGVFKTVGLDELFDFAVSRPAALALLQGAKQTALQKAER
jgi:anti-anti-sigma regulatory factor